MTVPQPPLPAAFMQHALLLARRAAEAGEVPVGAVVVREGVVVGEGYNQCKALNDPSAHAEIQALRAAAARLGNYRLEDCEVFVTLEPCAMCAQALLHARVRSVHFGAPEPRFGAAGSVLNLFAVPALNPDTNISGGLLADESRDLLQSFFRQRRMEQAEARQQPEQAPLREDALRTPETRFAALTDFASALDEALTLRGLRRRGRYLTSLPALSGLRLYGVELLPDQFSSGNAQGRDLALNLVLHGPDSWWPESVLQALGAMQGQTARGALPPTMETGHWLLPDLIGFGQSDKPKKPVWHSLACHVAYLQDYVAAYLGEVLQKPGAASAVWPLREVVLWFAPEQERLAASLQTALQGCAALQGRTIRLHPMASAGWGLVPSTDALAARLPAGWRELPFPDRGHEAARRYWGRMPAG